MRRHLFRLAGGKCHYCGIMTTLETGRADMATRDHVIPKSKGGKMSVLACYACNTARGTTEYSIFKQLVEQHGRPAVVYGQGLKNPAETLERLKEKQKHRQKFAPVPIKEIRTFPVMVSWRKTKLWRDIE